MDCGVGDSGLACMVIIHSGLFAPNTPTRPLTGTPTAFKPLAMSATLAAACACNAPMRSRHAVKRALYDLSMPSHCTDWAP